MKNIITLLLIIFSSVLFGQKKITFTHQVNYLVEDKNNYNEKVDSVLISFFYTQKGDIAFLNMKEVGSSSSVLIYKGKPYEVETSLNEIKFKKPSRYFSPSDIVLNNMIKEEKRLDKTEVINGIKCNYYKAKIYPKRTENEEGEPFEICLAENHQINSLSFFENTLKNKGLLLKFIPPSIEEPLTYISHKEISIEVDLDIENEVNAYNDKLTKMRDKQKNYEESHSSDIEGVEEYEEVPETTTVIQSAVEAVEAVANGVIVEEESDYVEVQAEQDVFAFYQQQVVWAKEALERAKVRLKLAEKNLEEYKESIDAQKLNKE